MCYVLILIKNGTIFYLVTCDQAKLPALVLLLRNPQSWSWRLIRAVVNRAKKGILFRFLQRPLCTRTRKCGWNDMSYCNNCLSGIKTYFGEKTDYDKDKLSNCN